MQTIDSYVTDVLMRDLVGHDRRPVAFLVYLWLTAEQQRPKRARSSELSGVGGIDRSQQELRAVLG